MFLTGFRPQCNKIWHTRRKSRHVEKAGKETQGSVARITTPPLNLHSALPLTARRGTLHAQPHSGI
ncbi:hypothetical protein E2C01_097709 [Portunus trituberculatus]|uniref:Uncharacterized protein n=1 Tax=Portunus trituberculatus TaxID=210409 RepID=A0A5B7KAQ0_PORTR|nr:hypothetical protein [Portunus trituberculatus]